MADRPAKRQRRSTVVLSDDDEEIDQISPHLPLRPSSKGNAQLQLDHGRGSVLTLSPSRTKAKPSKLPSKKATVKASPKSSPEKPRKNLQIKKEPQKSKSLHTFFSKATEEERWNRKSETPEADVFDGELGDAIEDDELFDEDLTESEQNNEQSRTVLDRRKGSGSRIKGLQKVASTSSLPTSSQSRFVKPPIPVKSTETNSTASSFSEASTTHRPWSDRYGPSNLDELVVHKKKVSDVQQWLESVFTGRNPQRVLVLRGPAGSGKTTTINLLAQTLRFGLVNWQNPGVLELGLGNSVATQFDDFLGRGGQFGSLLFSDDQPLQPSTESERDRKVLLMEEFPPTMTRSSGTLNTFRSAILSFLLRGDSLHPTPFSGLSNAANISPPLVMIISETLLSSSTAFSESFTAHRLLGPEILNHPLAMVMDFRPVAPTFVSKALDLVIKKEARDSKRRRMPGPAVLQRLADMGDVRSAVNSLEFLCVRGDSGSNWSGTVASKAKKSAKDSVPLTDMEKDSLSLVSQRETTLDMFHAAGKIVYNKREDPRILDSRASPPPKPPDHLMYLYTPKASQVNIDVLFNETGTDIQTFISTIHENYVLSCNGEMFVDALEACSDIFSISDILNPDSRLSRHSKNGNAAISQSNVQAGSSDTLRQDEISFQTATRGLLFSLPYPVNRATPPSGRKADAVKMFYPASLRFWKPTEEIDSLISLFVYDELLLNTVSTRNTFGSQGVASWRSRASDFDFVPPTDSLSQKEETEELAMKPPTNRDILALETLPYLTRIRASRNEDTKILSQITQMKGIQISGDEPSDDETEEIEGIGMNPIPAKAQGRNANQSSEKLLNVLNAFEKAVAEKKGSESEDMKIEKLYISDDDISDN